MSQFFEALERSERERTAKILSQKLHVLTVETPPAPAVAPPESLEKISDLKQIPVQTVDIKPSSRIVMHSDPKSPGADRFRYLRMRLQMLWNLGKLRSLLITSPLPQDGKSTIALNLATALAVGGERTVLLIEADCHHPTLANELGLGTLPGLAECLEAGADPMPAVRRIEPLGWYLLQAGQQTGVATDMFQSEALLRLMEQISPRFDWILFDAPPVIPVTDALHLSPFVSAALLVVREGSTPREDLEKAISLLGQDRVLGVVLNGAQDLNRLYSGYYGYKKTSR